MFNITLTKNDIENLKLAIKGIELDLSKAKVKDHKIRLEREEEFKELEKKFFRETFSGMGITMQYIGILSRIASEIKHLVSKIETVNNAILSLKERDLTVDNNYYNELLVYKDNYLDSMLRSADQPYR